MTPYEAWQRYFITAFHNKAHRAEVLEIFAFDQQDAQLSVSRWIARAH